MGAGEDVVVVWKGVFWMMLHCALGFFGGGKL